MFSEKLWCGYHGKLFYYSNGECISLCMSVKNGGKVKKKTLALFLQTSCPFQQPQLLKNNMKNESFYSAISFSMRVGAL